MRADTAAAWGAWRAERRSSGRIPLSRSCAWISADMTLCEDRKEKLLFFQFINGQGNFRGGNEGSD